MIARPFMEPTDIPRTTRPHHWSLTLLGIGLIIIFAYLWRIGAGRIFLFDFAELYSLALGAGVGIPCIPRRWPRLISVVALLLVMYGVTVTSYTQAITFADNVPKYSQKIRSILQPFQAQAEKFAKTSEAVASPESSNVVQVRQVHELVRILTHGAGTVTDIVLAASFIPFLAYFLLTWQSHARSATVMLFPSITGIRHLSHLG